MEIIGVIRIIKPTKLEAEYLAIKKKRTDSLDHIRKDSLEFYLQSSKSLLDKHKSDKALKQLEHALLFTSYDAEKERVIKEKSAISSINTFALIKAGKYKKAIPELNELITEDPLNANLIYNRALCYSKTGLIQEAVNDCKKAMSYGNKDALKLYNKINPIKKRISYYVTRCCDGSTSNAKGRGACSHHGGVCDWNEPVYEEYRKYE